MNKYKRKKVQSFAEQKDVELGQLFLGVNPFIKVGCLCRVWISDNKRSLFCLTRFALHKTNCFSNKCLPSRLSRPCSILILDLDDDELTGEETSILDSVVETRELFIGVAGVLVPESGVRIISNVELCSHDTLNVLQCVGFTKLFLPRLLKITVLCQLKLYEVHLHLAVLDKHAVLHHLPLHWH